MTEDMGGGNGIETYAFHHMDCSLDKNSGHFILAKWHGKDELHLTGRTLSLLLRFVFVELFYFVYVCALGICVYF